METTENCFNCAYLQAAFGITPTGFMCSNQVDRCFTKGMPESKKCENFLQKTGKTIKETLGQDVAGLRLILKERKWPEEYIEKFLNQDYALLSVEMGN